MESNNISTKIVSILIPLIIVLVVLVPFTTAITGGSGEGNDTQIITQNGAFMKEIKLSKLDKSQEYVIADASDFGYTDTQLVFYGLALADDPIGDSTSVIVTAYYGDWISAIDEEGSKTGIILSIEDGQSYLHSFEGEVDTGYSGQDIDEGYCDTFDAVSDQLILDWSEEYDSWEVICSYYNFALSGNSVYVATSEQTDYVGVHTPNYNDEYYLDKDSQILIWSIFNADVGFSTDLEIYQHMFNYSIYSQNIWTSQLRTSYYDSIDWEDTDGIYSGLNYVEKSPLNVTVKDSNVELTSKWKFDILGENIDFNNYNTSFTGIIPYKVALGGGDNGGLSGPTGTLIQMIPIFALLGILSALIVPMIRKEESI